MLEPEKPGSRRGGGLGAVLQGGWEGALPRAAVLSAVAAVVGCSADPSQGRSSKAAGGAPGDHAPHDSAGPGDDGSETGLPDPEGDPATVPLDGACPMAADRGGFVVELDLDYSIVDGVVLDGVVPVSVLTEEARSGDCRLLRRENPFCDPVCEPGFTCSLDEICVPYPAEVSLGTVTVAGLAQDVVMEPREPGARYFDTTLPHPAVEPGALVELRAGPPDEPGSVVLHGVGPQELEPLDGELVVVGGAALELRWTPPEGSVRSEVALSLNIDQHGASPLRIACAFADSGSGQIDGALTEALVAGGVTGFPSARLRRQTMDRQDLDTGCIDFGVASPRFVAVRVEGFTPCTRDEDCPEGQTCNERLEVCE